MLAAHLDAYVPDRPEALVFTGPSGRPMRRSNFNKALRWREIVRDLGVPGLHLHDLRHTGNTLAAGTPGASTRDLMERMGHDTMRAALIYQHTTTEADRRIADALSRALGDSDAALADTDAASGRATPGHAADSDLDGTVTRLSARGAHDPKRPARRRLGLTPRRPGIRGVQVSSEPSAGVVQWQNISFPS